MASLTLWLFTACTASSPADSSFQDSAEDRDSAGSEDSGEDNPSADFALADDNPGGGGMAECVFDAMALVRADYADATFLFASTVKGIDAAGSVSWCMAWAYSAALPGEVSGRTDDGSVEVAGSISAETAAKLTAQAWMVDTTVAFPSALPEEFVGADVDYNAIIGSLAALSLGIAGTYYDGTEPAFEGLGDSVPILIGAAAADAGDYFFAANASTGDVLDAVTVD